MINLSLNVYYLRFNNAYLILTFKLFILFYFYDDILAEKKSQLN